MMKMASQSSRTQTLLGTRSCQLSYLMIYPKNSASKPLKLSMLWMAGTTVFSILEWWKILWLVRKFPTFWKHVHLQVLVHRASSWEWQTNSKSAAVQIWRIRDYSKEYLKLRSKIATNLNSKTVIMERKSCNRQDWEDNENRTITWKTLIFQLGMYIKLEQILTFLFYKIKD